MFGRKKRPTQTAVGDHQMTFIIPAPDRFNADCSCGWTATDSDLYRLHLAHDYHLAAVATDGHQ